MTVMRKVAILSCDILLLYRYAELRKNARSEVWCWSAMACDDSELESLSCRLTHHWKYFGLSNWHPWMSLVTTTQWICFFITGVRLDVSQNICLLDIQNLAFLDCTLYVYIHIWVWSRNCSCLVTWFCYQLIAKPGNKTAAVSWPDPYIYSYIYIYINGLQQDNFARIYVPNWQFYLPWVMGVCQTLLDALKVVMMTQKWK